MALLAGLPVVLTTAFVQRGGGTRPEASAGDPEIATDVRDSEDDSTIGRLFTWRHAIGGGVLAFALLGLVTTGYMVMRVAGIGAPATLVAQGVFADGGEVVLADFESAVPETVPGELVTEALRIDLAQSTTLRLLPNSVVNAALERMLRDPADGLPADVALQLATREGAEGVLSGAVARAGSAIVITARFSAAGSGDELASFRVTARDEDDVIQAIDELSRRVREKVGESLRSVARSEPLRQVATSSLEALERFTLATQGLNRGMVSPPVALRLLEEAVTIDSTFAAAHRALSVTINNSGGDREAAARATHAAYRHRDRLPERERLFTEAYYHQWTGDRAQAIRAFRSILAVDSTSVGAAANLTDVLGFAGRYEEALEVGRLHPGWDEAAWTWNQAAAHVALGQTEDALAAVDSLRVRGPDHPYMTMFEGYVLVSSGRLDAAEALLESAPPSSDPVAFGFETYLHGVLRTLSGQLRAAAETLDGAERIMGEASGPSVRLSYGLVTPWTIGLIGGDTAAAGAEIERLLREVGWTEMSEYNRDYAQLALTWAVLGSSENARAMLDGYDAVATPSDRWTRGSAAIARALLAIRDGEPGAINTLETAAAGHPCDRCADFLLGFGFDLAGERQRAIAAYEEYLRFPFFDAPSHLMHIWVPTVHETLARLHEAEGNGARAAEHYRAFAEAWAEAHEDLQSRVRFARERAAALGPA